MRRINIAFALIAFSCLAFNPTIGQVGKKGEEKPAPSTSTTKKSTQPKKHTPPRSTGRSAVSPRNNAATPNDAAANERTFWESIRNSTNPEDFRAYLKKYPNGEFTVLAQNRLNTLISTPSPSLNPSSPQVANTEGGASNNSASNNPIDSDALYNEGLAAFMMGKKDEAEQTFNAVIRVNPKHTGSLYYLGQLAFSRNNMDAAISALNRATLIDAQYVSAWELLTLAYLRRARAATVKARADADYLSAVRAGESLVRESPDPVNNLLLGQALLGAEQVTRAITVLERAASRINSGSAFYLLGVAYSRTKNYPKAIIALERATQLSSDDADAYRELGYAYEASKQYSKALEAYQRGSQLTPNDEYFKQSIERVRPFAK